MAWRESGDLVGGSGDGVCRGDNGVWGVGVGVPAYRIAGNYIWVGCRVQRIRVVGRNSTSSVGDSACSLVPLR